MNEIGDLAAEGVGYLDAREYQRAQWAWEQSHPAAPFMQWLKTAGHISFNTDDVRVSGSSEPAIPIPSTKLAWAEITRLATILDKGWREVETAARDKVGASHLPDLTREVGAAHKRWPMVDKPHKIVDMRCERCGTLTLVYRPPRFPGDDVKADCSMHCGFELVGDGIAARAELLKAEELDRQKAAEKKRKEAERNQKAAEKKRLASAKQEGAI